MAAEIKQEIALEIAHVLFIDIVAYSKMASDDQRAAIQELNQIVQSTYEFRKSESENRLLKIATGEAGHILLSKRVAEDLEQFKHWRPHLYHLGECEVKHGEKIDIVNLFTAELGNSERPKRLTMPAQKTDFVPVAREPAPSRKSTLIIAASVAIAVLVVGSFLFWQRQQPKSSALASAISEKSIAVMPFENLSEDKANAYFADGIQDEILTRLSKIADLKVISRTSTQHYKSAPENLPEIAKQLGVANVLEGSVQKSGDAV